MNHDEKELNKFNALSLAWWDLNGPMRALHAMNPVRLNWIQNQMPLHNKKILDIGCGGGILCESLSKQGAIVTGIDLAKDTLAIAQQHAQQSQLNIRYLLTDAQTLSKQENEQYDAITCLELLEHVPNPALLVNYAYQLLKPGGMIFFSTINRTACSFVYAIVGAEYIAQLLPKGTHQYSRFIRPAELAQIIRNNHMQVVALTGIKSNLSATKFQLCQKTSVNYLLACKKDAL